MINLTIVKVWNIGNPGYNSNVTATLYSDGELDIASATGGSKMVDFGDSAEGKAPWKLEGNHTSIKNVYIVNVENIGNRAFKDCSNLVSVTFYNNYLKIIGKRAFDKCTSLQEIKIPNSVTEIEGEAFQWCNRLTTITSQNPTPPTAGENCFKGIKNDVYGICSGRV
jgi:hypothetical protein